MNTLYLVSLYTNDRRRCLRGRFYPCYVYSTCIWSFTQAALLANFQIFQRTSINCFIRIFQYFFSVFIPLNFILRRPTRKNNYWTVLIFLGFIIDIELMSQIYINQSRNKYFKVFNLHFSMKFMKGLISKKKVVKKSALLENLTINQE